MNNEWVPISFDGVGKYIEQGEKDAKEIADKVKAGKLAHDF